MIKKILLSFLVFVLVGVMSEAACAFTIKNESDRAFTVSSQDIDKLKTGIVFPKKGDRIGFLHCCPVKISIYGCDCCPVECLTVGPRDEVEIEGSKGKYRIEIEPEGGSQITYKFGCKGKNGYYQY